MTPIFADTCYWIALLNRKDQLHATAVAAQTKIGNAKLVTTDEVLTEVLNFFGQYGSSLRSAAAQTVKAVRSAARVTVAPQSRQTFDEALDLYENRPDKTYSLTDCRSFALMRHESITVALTADKHFVQEGFTTML
jgi:predicted nucleic acid-binding protein